MRDIQPTKQYSRIQNYSAQIPNSNSYSDFESENKKNRKYVIMGFAISFVVLALMLALATYVFNGAIITIKPVKRDQPINETFVIEPEMRNSILQIKVSNQSDTISLPKSSIKKVLRKAEGEIIVFNSSDAKPQKLIKGTRFSTSDGKIYRLIEGVTVPGKVDGPGSIRTRVLADQDGEAYNIGPTKFTIPGFKGTSKFTTFYAESKVSMAGGSSGKSADVSDLDMEKGKQSVKEKLQTNLFKNLESSVPEGYSFSKDTVFTEYGSFAQIDQDKTTSTFEMKATATTVYLKRNELVKSIVEKTEKLNEANATVDIVNSDNFVISIPDLQDINDISKPIRILITGSAQVVFKPNASKIADYIAGKSRGELNTIIKKFQFVDGVTSSVIRPFWSGNFPTDISKIEVQIEK